VRDALALTDVSYMQRFSFPEDKGLDFLDSLCAGNVAKVRFGRMLHTFIADENGHLLADCYVANNDEQFVLLAETIVDAAAFKDLLLSRGAADAGMVDLSESHALLSVDGYKAWAVVKGLFGADVLGLPYLSVERYDFQGEPLALFRAGKTSSSAITSWRRHRRRRRCSMHAWLLPPRTAAACAGRDPQRLRLEGRFFNIFAEGAAVRDPLVLGLQWMIDFGKAEFLGSKAIFAHRAATLSHKIIGICTESGAKNLSRARPSIADPHR